MGTCMIDESGAAHRHVVVVLGTAIEGRASFPGGTNPMLPGTPSWP